VLSRDDATALVVGSRLLDEHWYAALTGRTFGSREEAAAAWVADPADHAPHPLFEPLWLYPGGAWRRHAPDPLSHYLSRAAAGSRPSRSPHPCYDQAALGPLEEWLADHDPAELLPAPEPRDLDDVVAVVEVPTDDVRRAVRWLRHLHRAEPPVAASARAEQADVRRLLAAVSADLPRAVVHRPTDDGEVVATGRHLPVVTVDAGLEPPRWPWLAPLLDALAGHGVTAAQPLVLAEDLTVAAPVLVGHPVSAVERLDGEPLPARFSGVEARLPGAEGAAGTAVLAASSWVVGDVPAPTGPGWSELEERARAVTVVEGVPSLRWSIDIAAGAAPVGRRWGDWHFARSLADALGRLGQWVEVDHPETRGRATRGECDVVLVLRGLERVAPAPGATSLLWVISHPGDVTPAELAAHDVAFAASTTWAARHGVAPLLQCTDTTRFHPGASTGGPGRAPGDGRVLFVGNARGGMRPVVAAAREAGVPLEVIGTGWAEHGVAAVADRIANADLPAAYASAGVVLNDHHSDMAAEGFVSNRVLDVLAVGGRLLTDPVAGLDEVLGVTLPTWRTPADLARLTTPPYDAWPGADVRLALAERVVAEHSFDARARTLLDAALRVR
jgi:hypothetical protein